MGIWDDINSVVGEANPYVRDLIPGFGAVQDVLGGIGQMTGLAGPSDLYPGMAGYQPPESGAGLGGGGQSTPARVSAGGAQGGDILGGASGTWWDEMPGMQTASNPGAPYQWSGSTGGGMYDLTTLGGSPMAVGPRRLFPLSAGWPGPGYRAARRGSRRPSAGHPAGLYWVPRRKMNPLNPRALMKAERRMSAFTHWVKRHFAIASSMPRRRRAPTRRAASFRRKKR